MMIKIVIYFLWILINKKEENPELFFKIGNIRLEKLNHFSKT